MYRANQHLLIALRRNAVVIFIVGIEHAVGTETAFQQNGTQPIILDVIAGIVQVAHPAPVKLMVKWLQQRKKDVLIGPTLCPAYAKAANPGGRCVEAL